MIEETHTCLAGTSRSQETVGYSAGHDVTLGTWQSAPDQALFHGPRWHLVSVLGKVWTCGNWGNCGECLHSSFLSSPIWLYWCWFLKWNENNLKMFIIVGLLGNLLVLWCLSVWLTGPRSNYIRQVLFYFFPCRILGRVWRWSWLSCPSLSAFFVWNSKGKMNCRVRWAVFEYSSPVLIPLIFFLFFCFLPPSLPSPVLLFFFLHWVWKFDIIFHLYEDVLPCWTSSLTNSI